MSVPCSRCGKPRKSKGRSILNLCRPCWLEWVKEPK